VHHIAPVARSQIQNWVLGLRNHHVKKELFKLAFLKRDVVEQTIDERVRVDSELGIWFGGETTGLVCACFTDLVPSAVSEEQQHLLQCIFLSI
jgi:hypothetical protein